MDNHKEQKIKPIAKKTFNRIYAIFSAFLFLIIFIFILNFLSELLGKKTDITFALDEFYELSEEENFDILIIGSSHVFRGIDPSVLDEGLGTNSYNLATSAQVISQSYYTLVEALKYTVPEVVLLDSYFINAAEIVEKREYFAFEQLAAMPMSMNKINYMTDLFPPKEYINALFPAIREHDNWEDEKILEKNMTYLKTGENPHSWLNRGYVAGYSNLTEENIKEYEAMKATRMDYVVREEAYPYIEDIAKLCEEEDIRLILVNTPLPKVVQEKINDEYQYEQTKLVTDQLNLEYIDFNVLYDEVGFDNSHFLEEANPMFNHHVNNSGAAVISEYLVEVLKDESF